ncbi:hypothetical protein GLOTRDRAFT_131162 [Gloeophyllum trabeum ATCC 11539]|uniref:Uncharacterized protein n=1 Tax=Gloeophyllum trabeum (strain ATCC 11539 / FP-39264 / Madison 617) TaxID=670483 RepID=S7Q2Q0_GLOTA|nr:uncharacterized protein GLOTRDRAFT_131162 [Gloeophyllum trabeum ATCC 11539]EPQ53832.1 hypothetical protein GLOTRDRAFT_131162 [Gloeophyllum trabeum ATCC 11539]
MQHPVQDTTYNEQGAPATDGGPRATGGFLRRPRHRDGRAPRDDFEREIYTEVLARAYAQILARENLESDLEERGIELSHIEGDGALKPRMGNMWALEHDAYQAVYANAFAQFLAQEAFEEEEAEGFRRGGPAEVEFADGSAMDISFHGTVDPMECEVAEGPAGMPVSILAGLDHVDEEPMDVDLPHEADDVGDIDIHDASMTSMAPFDFAQPAHPLHGILGAFGNISLWSNDEVDAHLD